MNAKQLEYFRQKLTVWRAELLKESQETIDHLKEEEWREPDLSDRASLETEAGVELRTRKRYLKLIGKIDAALREADRGGRVRLLRGNRRADRHQAPGSPPDCDAHRRGARAP